MHMGDMCGVRPQVRQILLRRVDFEEQAVHQLDL